MALPTDMDSGNTGEILAAYNDKCITLIAQPDKTFEQRPGNL